MAISTYDELQAAVANWVERDDLTTRIPEFITLGETVLNRRLRTRDMEASVTVTPSTTVRYVALPAGYMELVSFTDDLGHPLSAVDSETLENIAYGQSAARPSYYRISSRIDFDAVADKTYSFKLNYLKRLDIATGLTNAVLTNHPDCYLYSALLQSAPFIMDDERINTWRALLEVAVRDANNQENRNMAVLRTDLPSALTFNILTG